LTHSTVRTSNGLIGQAYLTRADALALHLRMTM
jgi:hypothetical protein